MQILEKLLQVILSLSELIQRTFVLPDRLFGRHFFSQVPESIAEHLAVGTCAVLPHLLESLRP